MTLRFVLAVPALALAAWLPVQRAVSARDARDEPVAVWVFFQPDRARSDLAPAIGEDARALRVKLGLPAFENDRPLPPSLLQAVAATGAELRHVSRWLRAVSVRADARALERILALEAVSHVRRVGSMTRAGSWPLEPAGAATLSPVPQGQDSAFYGPNWAVLREIGVPPAHVAGFTGKSIRLAILDTGFEPRHESLAGRVVFRTRDFINGDANVFDEPGDAGGPGQARHGTQVWSVLGGFRPGRIVGPAYDAQFVLAKVDLEPGDTRADEDRWVAAVEWADSLGVRLIVSALTFRFGFTDRPDISYGELNGDSTLTTRIADEAARRGILVVNAVGDDGPDPGSLSAPADADSVLAVGASDASGQAATFGFGGSARGPTADGRIKPEVVARGVGIFAASSLSFGAYDIALAGTSYSTALVAGGAAAFMEAWPNLSAAAVRRALILAGDRTVRPDNATGHGIPNIASAILFPEGVVPTAVATLDLQGSLTTIAPTFSWRASLVQNLMQPVVYRVELATDSLFANIVFSDTVREAFSLTARRPVRAAQRVWWRVVGTASLGIRRVSPPGEPFLIPSWVRLISPNPDEVSFVTTPRPELSWTPLSAPPPIGPFVYDVEILSNETGRPVQPALRNLTTASVRPPEPLVPNTAYRWRVIARTQTGDADTVESTNPFVVTSATRPPATLLYQNFPNPFPRRDLARFETRIWFDLAEASDVELTVLDLRGRLVRHLIPAAASCGRIRFEPGIYGRGAAPAPADSCVLTTWDGTDGDGREVARGVYILRLRASGRDYYRRMVFLPEG